VQTSVKKIILFLLDKFLLCLSFREYLWVGYGGAVMVPFYEKVVVTALWSLWFLPSICTGNDALFFVNRFAVQIIFVNSRSLVQTNFPQSS